MIRRAKSFMLEAKKVYLQNINRFHYYTRLAPLPISFVLSIHLLAFIHTFSTMIGGMFMPYTSAFRMSLAWAIGSAFAVGIGLYRLAYVLYLRN